MGSWFDAVNDQNQQVNVSKLKRTPSFARGSFLIEFRSFNFLARLSKSGLSVYPRNYPNHYPAYYPKKPCRNSLCDKALGMDDIGLETNVGTAALHRTCDEPPIPQEPFAPEDAPTKVESDLRTIIAVWQRLSDSTRRMIMNTVKEEIDSLHSSTGQRSKLLCKVNSVMTANHFAEAESKSVSHFVLRFSSF